MSNDIPEDIAKTANTLANLFFVGWVDIHDVIEANGMESLVGLVEQALLAERVAQRERDAAKADAFVVLAEEMMKMDPDAHEMHQHAKHAGMTIASAIRRGGE